MPHVGYAGTGAGRRTAMMAALVAAAPGTVLASEVVAEAVFVPDTLPPGSVDLGLSLTLARGEPQTPGERAPLVTLPRLQLALPLGERLGATAEVGLVGATRPGTGVALDTPALALKYTLREPAPGTAGLSASLELYGSVHSLRDTELGVNLGAIRALGPVTLRAATGLASTATRWSPHLHVGASVAAQLSAGWRLLGEAVGAWPLHPDEGRSLSVGPALKRALGERAALTAGAVLGIAGEGRGALTGQLQLTVAL